MLTPADASILECLANMTETHQISKKQPSSCDRNVQRQLEFSLLTPERRELEPMKYRGRGSGNSSSPSGNKGEETNASLMRKKGQPQRKGSRERRVLAELQNRPEALEGIQASRLDSINAPRCRANKKSNVIHRDRLPGSRSRAGSTTETDSFVVINKSRWARMRALLSRLPKASEEQASPADFRSLIDESPRHILRRPFEASHPHWEILRLREALEQERESARQQEEFAASEHAERCATEMAYYRIFQECNNLRQNVNHLEQALLTLRADLDECLTDLANGHGSREAALEHRLREMQDIVHVATYAIRNETAYVPQPLSNPHRREALDDSKQPGSSVFSPVETSPQRDISWDTWWPTAGLDPVASRLSRSTGVVDVDARIDTSSMKPPSEYLGGKAPKPEPSELSRQYLIADAPPRRIFDLAPEASPKTSPAASIASDQQERQALPKLHWNEEHDTDKHGMPAPDLLLFGSERTTTHARTSHYSNSSAIGETHGLLASLDAC